MAKKVCEICGDKPATVPDRERMGRLINRVCSSCHALRLAGDMKRIISAAELARTGVIAAGDPEVRADVTDQNISDIADALRASLRRASLPTCPHTLTLVPPADLHAKIPEYAFLITQLLDERGALYAALERLEIKP